MKLTLESLKSAGGFAARQPVERRVSWRHAGEEYTATVYVRPLSYLTAKEDIAAVRENRDGLASRIAACIVDEQGEPVFTAADVTGEADPERGPLNEGLAMALLNAIGEVSGLGKPPAPSAKKKSSGTSS